MSLAEFVWETTFNGYTPDEPWHTLRGGDRHWYEASADFAKRYLRPTGERKLLCVASPILEARELEAAGWEVAYLDVRKPPKVVNWIEGDAAQMPFEAHSFDALSSSCVVCHVGLGRYGDAKRERGDVDMLRECARVLKPGALAQITLPVCDTDRVQRVGSCHRVYPVDVAMDMAEAAGFAVERCAIWDTKRARWMHEGEPISGNLSSPDNMSMLLRAS